jgi:hypothetical protein
VGIIAGVTDNCDAFCVSLKVRSIHTKQEFRRVVTLVEERMASGSVAIQALKVELRASRVVQLRRIGMGSQCGPVSRNIMSNKLPENRPTSGGAAQGVGSVLSVSTIAEASRATKGVQELLIGLKRR